MRIHQKSISCLKNAPSRGLFLLLLSLPLMVAAQSWNATSYDFGTIMESEGPKTGEFQLLNDSGEPISILKVKTSCGCTEADFDKGEIAPGARSTLRFAYDPTRRPGRFDKSIRVYIQQGDELGRVDTLRICGNVVPAASTLAADFPVVVGPLRLASKLADMGRVKGGLTRHSFIQVFNTSPDTVSCRLTSDSPALKATLVPERLGPGDGGVISLTLDSGRETRSGEIIYELMVSAGGRTLALPVHADIQAPDPAFQTVATDKEKSGKHTLFPKTYTEVKDLKKEAEKKKKGLFPKTYTEVKKDGKKKEKDKEKDKDKDKKQGLFPKTYTEVKKAKK